MNMANLFSYLGGFNRKERFFLIGMVLDNATFRLPSSFRTTLGDALGLHVPENAFAAMDYHLDWLAASLFLAAHNGSSGPYPRDPEIFTATQEDLDFLVAYEDDKGCHLIMLEAKGVTAYSNRQFRSKVTRLATMFKTPEARAAKAIPHFVLVSPREPRFLREDDCPRWMLSPEGKIPWLRLELPSGLKKVVRCHQNGNVSHEGDYWKVVTEKGDLMVKLWQIGAEDFVPKEQVARILEGRTVPSEATALEWVSQHLLELQNTFAGRWIAVAGDQVVAASPNLRGLMEQLADMDVGTPFITEIPSKPVVWHTAYAQRII